MKKLNKLKVDIFTEEYKIIVYLGTKDQITKAVAKYLDCSVKSVASDFEGCRGRAWNALADVYKNKNPVIAIDTDRPAHIALSTVAHEASHAMDFIEEYIGVNDLNGEFHAHGISAVMRAIGNKLLK